MSLITLDVLEKYIGGNATVVSRGSLTDARTIGIATTIEGIFADEHAEGIFKREKMDFAIELSVTEGTNARHKAIHIEIATLQWNIDEDLALHLRSVYWDPLDVVILSRKEEQNSQPAFSITVDLQDYRQGWCIVMLNNQDHIATPVFKGVGKVNAILMKNGKINLQFLSMSARRHSDPWTVETNTEETVPFEFEWKMYNDGTIVFTDDNYMGMKKKVYLFPHGVVADDRIDYDLSFYS